MLEKEILSRLREINDNSYVFSCARSDFGRIVASRTCFGLCDGMNIFDVISIDGAEKAAAFRVWENDPKRSLLMSCHNRGNASVCLIIPVVSSGSSLCFLYEQIMPSRAFAELILSQREQDVYVSENALRYIDSMGTEDGVGMRTVSGIFLRNAVLRENTARKNDFSSDLSAIINIAKLIAETVGVDIEYAVLDGMPSRGREGIFVPGFLNIALIIMSMAARRFSGRRTLSAVIMPCNGATRIQLSFDICRESRDLLFGSALKNAASNMGIPISITESDGRCMCELIPYHHDIGMVGVKQGMQSLNDDKYRMFL